MFFFPSVISLSPLPSSHAPEAKGHRPRSQAWAIALCWLQAGRQNRPLSRGMKQGARPKLARVGEREREGKGDQRKNKTKQKQKPLETKPYHTPQQFPISQMLDLEGHASFLARKRLLKLTRCGNPNCTTARTCRRGAARGPRAGSRHWAPPACQPEQLCHGRRRERVCELPGPESSEGRGRRAPRAPPPGAGSNGVGRRSNCFRNCRFTMKAKQGFSEPKHCFF